MDFLDPRKRHRHDIILMCGYGLMAIAIGLTSVILVYGASGYGINTKTGSVIQNGLLFVDSKPSGASIYLNNKLEGTTGARLVIPAGSYKLILSKSGYRDWQRQFNLNENSVFRFAYPFLFPVSLTPKDLKIYNSPLSLITESLDKHWLLVQISTSDSKSLVFDMFDTSKLDQSPVQVSLPPSLLNGSGPHVFKAVDWASNNNQVLIEHDFSGGSEFIIFNRADPASSFNINQTLTVSPSQVSLRDKKADQLYLYNQNGQSLSLGDISKNSVQLLLNHVLAYKTYGPDLASYVTDQNVAAGQVMARIRENNKTYPLFTFAAGDRYFIDAAQYQGHWYYVAGSNKSDRINIYKDPLSGIKDPQTAKAIPLISLPEANATSLAFSDNARLINLEAGQKFAVYDIEGQNRVQYDLSAPLGEPLHWMDGHRLIGITNGSVLVMDFDGTNQQVLIPASSSQDIFFDKNLNQMLTITTANGGFTLQRTDLRAGTDLPKQ